MTHGTRGMGYVPWTALTLHHVPPYRFNAALDDLPLRTVLPDEKLLHPRVT